MTQAKVPLHVAQYPADGYYVEIDRVGGAHRAGPHPVGYGIADKLSLAQIELQVLLQPLADVRSQADVQDCLPYCNCLRGLHR